MDTGDPHSWTDAGIAYLNGGDTAVAQIRARLARAAAAVAARPGAGVGYGFRRSSGQHARIFQFGAVGVVQAAWGTMVTT